MIRFADDFVVLVRGTEAQAHAIKEQTAKFMAEQMRLTLSPEKTAITQPSSSSLTEAGLRLQRPDERGDELALTDVVVDFRSASRTGSHAGTTQVTGGNRPDRKRFSTRSTWLLPL
jgi:hypothetical protein